jgi:hypothetical protein
MMASKKIGGWYAAGYNTRERRLCIGWVSLYGRKRRAKDDASRSREIEAERGKGKGSLMVLDDEVDDHDDDDDDDDEACGHVTPHIIIFPHKQNQSDGNEVI